MRVRSPHERQGPSCATHAIPMDATQPHGRPGQTAQISHITRAHKIFGKNCRRRGGKTTHFSVLGYGSPSLAPGSTIAPTPFPWPSLPVQSQLLGAIGRDHRTKGDPRMTRQHRRSAPRAVAAKAGRAPWLTWLALSGRGRVGEPATRVRGLLDGGAPRRLGPVAAAGSAVPMTQGYGQPAQSEHHPPRRPPDPSSTSPTPAPSPAPTGSRGGS